MNKYFYLVELVAFASGLIILLALALIKGGEIERNSVQHYVCLKSTETYKAYKVCKSRKWDTFKYQLVLDNQ